MCSGSVVFGGVWRDLVMLMVVNFAKNEHKRFDAEKH